MVEYRPHERHIASGKIIPVKGHIRPDSGMFQDDKAGRLLKTVCDDANSSFTVPPVVSHIFSLFENAGHQIFVVGGMVRSSFLGESPKDIDLCTSALPNEIASLVDDLGAVYPLGEKFGTVAVNIDGETVEITTFRTEQYNSGSRKPEVMFGDDLYGDLARRDFTINAMAIGPDGNVIDPFGGVYDLEHGVVKAVGDPFDRFSEDPLRVIRSVRFAATLGFFIDEDTLLAAKTVVDEGGLSIVSQERFTAELLKIFRSTHPTVLQDAVQLAYDTHTEKILFGELLEGVLVTPQTVPAKVRLEAAYLRSPQATKRDLVSGMKFSSSTANRCEHVREIVNIVENGKDHQIFSLIRKHNDDLLSIAGLASSQKVADKIGSVSAKDRVRLRAPLPVDGKEIMEITGLSPGKRVGEILRGIESYFLLNKGSMSRNDTIRIIKNMNLE